MTELEEEARQIALLISGTAVEERGILFSHVSKYLVQYSQGYTGKLVLAMAKEYGYDRK
jgi:hypothetical protein